MCDLHKGAVRTLKRLYAMLFLQVADRLHDWNEHLGHLYIFEGFKIWIELGQFHGICNLGNQPLRSNGQVIFSAEHFPYIHWGAQGSPLWFRLGEMASHSWRSKTQVASSLVSFVRHSGWIWKIHVWIYCWQAGFERFFISTCTYYRNTHYILDLHIVSWLLRLLFFFVGWFLERCSQFAIVLHFCLGFRLVLPITGPVDRCVCLFVVFRSFNSQ